MKNRLTNIAVLTALISLLPPAVIAQDDAAPEPKKKNAFVTADANHDGFLGKEEFMAMPNNKDNAKAEKRYAALDKDGDGKLSAEEFKAGAGKGKGKKKAV